jgi:hypothetical protein
MTPSTQAPRIFVSYTRESMKQAGELRDHEIARTLGLSACELFVCHVHAKDRYPGFSSKSQKDQKADLSREIGNSDGIVILWDRNYARSAWCGWELSRILSYCRPHKSRPPSSLERDIPVHIIRNDRTPLPPVLRSMARPTLGAGLRTNSPITVNPGFSLVESPYAPQLGASLTARLLGLTLRLTPLVVTAAAQAWLWHAARGLCDGAYAHHMWALATTLGIALTLCVGLLASVWAGVVGGAVTSILGLFLSQDIHSSVAVTFRGAGLTAFSCSLAFWWRTILQAGLTHSEPLDTHSEPLNTHSEPLDHIQPSSRRMLAGAALAATLLTGALATLWIDQAHKSSAASPAMRTMALLQQLTSSLPRIGGAIGAMFGIALGVALGRRISSGTRDAEKTWMMPILSGTALAVACIAGGTSVARWILENVKLAAPGGSLGSAGELAGAYAGGLLGLVACSAMALPVTFADARADPRSELRWATFSLVACCGVILLMIRSMEFGRQGPAQRDAILWGTIAGLAAAKSIGWIATRRPPAPFALTTSLVTHLGLIAWAMRPAGNAAQHAPAPTPPRLEPVEISLPPAATRASLPAEDRAPSTTVESVAPAGEAPNSKSSEHLHEVRRELKKVVRERRRHMLRTEKAALVAFAKRAGATAGLVGAETSSCSGGEIPCLTICDAGVIGNASAAGVTLLIPPFHIANIGIFSDAGTAYGLTITCDGDTRYSEQLKDGYEYWLPIEADAKGKRCVVSRDPGGVSIKQDVCPRWKVEDSGDSDYNEPCVHFMLKPRLPSQTPSAHAICNGECLREAERRVQLRALDLVSVPF